MFKYKIILFLLLTAFIVPPAYCQGKPESHQLKTIGGIVINVDAVGNIITIRTEDQNQMAFFVPEKISITHETHDIGLIDIRVSDPLIIQYYIASPGKYAVASIVDNQPVASE